MKLTVRAAWAVALACSLFGHGAAHAGVRTITPGKAHLAEGEGLLAVVIDSDMPMEYAEVKAVGGLAGEQIKQIGIGRRLALLAAPPGTYRYGKVQWGSGMTTRSFWNLSDKAAYRCTIEPGVINYCGDLRIRHAGGDRAVFAYRNRTASATQLIDREFPELRATYPLRYRGRYVDPYPEWISVLERNPRSAPPLPALRATATVGVPDAETFFRAERVASMRINPSGSLLVETGHLGTDHVVAVIDVASGQSTEIHRGKEEPLSALWAGESVIVLSFDAPGAVGTNVIVAKLTHVPGQTPVAHAFSVPGTGWLVDAVPADDGQILFSRYDVNRGFGLYRLDISGRSIASTQFDRRHRIGEHVDSPVAWLIDARGQVETMMVASDDGVDVRRRKGDGFVRVATVASGERFVPVGIDDDGTLLVLTDRGRKFTELCRFLPGAAEPLSTVLAVDGADLVSVERDSSRNIIGARYYLDGRLRTAYRDRVRGRSQAALEKAFPLAQVVVVDTSRNGARTVLLVDGPATPPAFYLYDRERRAVELLGQAYPALEKVRFVAPERLVVRTPDGLDIEAFLYAPHGAGPHPLVVMPHGGPLGVFDDQHFDHDVQFLAVRGYAVLQVNFRGSGGKGRALRDAGLRAAGGKIEEDVMLALDRAIERAPIDRSRVCMLGASYGGYSALRSTLRWPDRFRCAVSIAGPTDLALQFTGSDAADDDRAIASASNWLGDPVRDAADLRARSPLYADPPIARPVLLIHGAEDDRVPLEHALRFERAMALRGRPVRLVTLPDEGHGFVRLDSKVTAWDTIDRFLAEHLRSVR